MKSKTINIKLTHQSTESYLCYFKPKSKNHKRNKKIFDYLKIKNFSSTKSDMDKLNRHGTFGRMHLQCLKPRNSYLKYIKNFCKVTT